MSTTCFFAKVFLRVEMLKYLKKAFSIKQKRV